MDTCSNEEKMMETAQARKAANRAARLEFSSPIIRKGDTVRTTGMTWTDDDGWANGCTVLRVGFREGERYVIVTDGNAAGVWFPDRRSGGNGQTDVVQITGRTEA